MIPAILGAIALALVGFLLTDKDLVSRFAAAIIGAIVGFVIGGLASSSLGSFRYELTPGWNLVESRPLVSGTTSMQPEGQLNGAIFLVRGWFEEKEYYKFWMVTEFGVRAEKLEIFGREPVDVVEEDRTDGLWLIYRAVQNCPPEARDDNWFICTNVTSNNLRHELHVPLGTIVQEDFRFELGNS